ncbi:Filamentous hemagglutinin family N-terminal domain protein [uncultured Sporomusa sp.]|uniref:Filamentous hemagglutinin family N-terminal domain protein n=1 Tax=uncultured Sporomusa sp. TaxID=307249 RepID=A0A212LZS0_9FIRM|nr:hemagglutinin repeat-containing protein [uncultured Sporomusa sp.]SCM83023.1 Filamentous hemagglutinin family N-terminal domain protein [uncultured Sporomusa sp.]
MNFLSKGKQKIIAYLIIGALQCPTLAGYAAAVEPDASAGANAPAVTGQNGVPVVTIVKPNETGLSHNKFTDFNVGLPGLIFNNNAGNTAVASKLAGPVGPNTGLGGQAAAIILNEVTGGNISNLNGMMEVAGTKAAVIIANPNGITGSGFGFINTSRASLVTGTPNIVGGHIDSFTITGGRVTVEGSGNAPELDDVTGKYVHEPVSKLDIMTRAAAINADLWAQDEINIITGANTVNYQTLAATPIENPPADKKPDIALDIAALGGMYAGKIQLVGTEKGLGYNILGDIYANNSLAITNDGKITFIQNDKQYIEDGELYTDETGIVSDGSIRIAATGDIENKGQLVARRDIAISAEGAVTNEGIIQAGVPYEEDEDNPDSVEIIEPADLIMTGGGKIVNTGVLEASSKVTVAGEDTFSNSGQVTAGTDLNITAAGAVTSTGVLAADGAVTLTGDKVKYTPLGVTGASVQVIQTNPDPEPEEPPNPEEQGPVTTAPDTPAIPDLPDIAENSAPAATVHVAKDDNLRLTADANAAGQYRPIIDKAANGVDLVQIAEANTNGVSRNLYTDFNIKSTGLILNNSEKYVKTELGGYIDRNMNIAGNGASVILNEVTSANNSVLNGYLEVAGNKASVVIANANGISVNGLGFINTANAVLATAKVSQWKNGNITFGAPTSDLLLQGDGLNARTTTGLSLITRQFTAEQSEIWANNLDIAADGTLTNTGKISADQNITVRADRFTNTENGYIEAAGDIAVAVNQDVTQDAATLLAGGDITISGQQLQNKNNSMIDGKGNIAIAVAGSVDNTKSIVRAEQNLALQAADFANTGTALVSYGQNGQFDLQNQMVNDHATIIGNGSIIIRAGAVENTNHAVINTGKDVNVQATRGIVQDHAVWTAGGDVDMEAASFSNTNNSFLAADGNVTVKTSGDVLNDAATIRAGQTGSFAGDNITNQNQGAFLIDGALAGRAKKTFANTTGLIAAGSTASVTAQTINNTKNSVFYAGDDLTLTAAGTVLNQSSDIESRGDISIKAKELINEKEIFETAWIVTNQRISYKIPYSHMGGDYYNGMRTFNRIIHTGNITEETAGSHILANGSIDIEGNIANRYSTISAGKDLTITGDKLENLGYQGTIHHDDYGNNTYYWKYKKHRRAHIRCRMKYGTTILPYEDHNVYEQEIERLSVLSANGKVTLNTTTIDNKTVEAGGEVITFKTKNNKADLTDKLSGAGNTELDISNLKINTLIFTLNQDPSAKYLVETNKQFADYHNFLSSDYLLDRVKADPAKVAKRLGDGYYEQKLVTEQLTGLTGKRFLDGYSSDLEQYKALMENGAVAAEEMGLTIGVGLTAEQVASLTSDIVWLVEETINGQKVLVPEVYLSSLKAEDLSESGALIVGGDIELYAKQDITNLGTIKADKTVVADAENITNLYGKIKGNDINLTARETIQNISGEIRGQNDVSLTANDIVNQTETKTTTYRELEQTVIGDTALITAGSGSLSLEARNDIVNQGAVLSAGQDVTLKAGNNIDITSVAAEKHVAVTYPKSSVTEDRITHQQSVLGGSNITLEAGSDINLSGALTAAEENTTLTAGRDITISAVKDLDSLDSSVGRRGGSHFTRDKTVDETVVGTQLGAGQDITVQAGRDITVKGSGLASEQGKVELTGENVSISGETEYHERLHEEHREKAGFLSSTKTDIYDRQTLEGVAGSSISGDSVDITDTGKDITISGSSVVADNDVTLKAKENVTITSQEETSSSEYQKQVKKSGLLSGGGLGFSIGKEKQKDTYANQNIEQAGSTVGSIDGNVTIEAGKDVTVAASDVIAGQDISLTGETVTIESKDNIYNAQEKHEYKKSGLTVAIGGKTVEAINKVVAPLERATQVKDERLAALYGYKVYDELTDKTKTTKKDLEGIKDPQKNFTVEVSLGSQKSESKAQSSTTLAQGSNVTAGGDVTIQATKDDLNIHGSNVSGENVTLKAQENINITASDNTNTTDQTSKSSSGSIGVSISAGGISGINAGYNKAKGEVKENSTTYNPSSVTASDTLTLESGKDTNIIGSKVSGDTVKADVGENLNIESLQEKESYDEKNSSSGLSISADISRNDIGKNVTGKPGMQGSANKGKIKSDYQSVTEQAGIYAGEGGFDINVGKNTDLKGAVISSEATPDKNRISTDTLTWSDIENKAEYSASSVGVNIDTNKYDKDDPNYKNQGLTPNIGVKASGDAESITESAISPGTIEVRSNPNQDLSNLNRDPADTLNTLNKIFDKKTVEEQQELANLFGEEAYKAIGKLANSQLEKAVNDANQAIKNGDVEAYNDAMQRKTLWEEGGANKIALHALVGGIMADLGGSTFTSGAIGAGINQAVQKELAKLKDQPDVWQWASAVIGSAAAEVVGGDAQTGASTAASGTKNNELSDILLHPITTGEGFINGVKSQGIETADAFKDIIANPITTIAGLGSLFVDIWNEPSLVAQIGKETLQQYQDRFNTLVKGSAYETGEEIGRFSVELATAFLSAGIAGKLVEKVPAFKRAVEVLNNRLNSNKLPEGPSKAVFKAGKTTIEDIAANPKALSGKSAEEVAQMLREAGYDVTVQASKKSTSGAQIIKINNPGEGRNITQVQVSPGGGRHGANPYVKISTSDQGIIKIVDGAEDIYKTDGVETAKIIFTGGK